MTKPFVDIIRYLHTYIMDTKKSLGQFFTTNYEYILSGMQVPPNVETIIEPFVGNGDLLKYLGDNHEYIIERYDIDPKSDEIIEQDTLMKPPSYANKYVITNPPYLAKNKATDKSIFNKYKVDDLYKAFIVSLLNDPPIGAIIIVPLNIFSSMRQADINLRKRMVSIFAINKVNIFEERVFEDTSYTVCCIQLSLLNEDLLDDKINITMFPSNHVFKTRLDDTNSFTIGGEIYNLPSMNKYKITRLTSQNKDTLHSNILIKCIDDSINKLIGLSYVDVDGIYIDETPNLSARSYATLIITPHVSEDIKKKLVEQFNDFMQKKRSKYNSLFLTNYRESKNGFARKRISFSLVYQICVYLLDAMSNSD